MPFLFRFNPPLSLFLVMTENGTRLPGLSGLNFVVLNSTPDVISLILLITANSCMIPRTKIKIKPNKIKKKIVCLGVA